MLRILFFLVLVFAIGLGFAWLAERPGEIVVTFGGYRYQLSLMVAAVVVTAVVAAVMILWWLVKSILAGPQTISRYFRTRRRDRGYQALSTGMIAAGAGDATLARRKKKEALKLLSADQEPLIHLLDAQASLLEGDHQAAREKFEAMLDDPETRLLGLRGLYLEAERLGDRAAARHYAARAAQDAPQLVWAGNATLEDRTEAGEWDEALRLVETQKATRQIDRDAAHRRKAVLLTAKSMAILDTDPTGARNAGLEANRVAPDFVPGALAAARALFRLNDLRKGSKLLEASWKAGPHPEVADLYVHARSGDSTHDRLERAKKLQSYKRNHAESALAVARAALDAGEFALARREAEAAARLAPREGAYLLLADIEEAETGDQGKVRQWLGMAVRAPRDPAWVADGYVAERWAPTSPVTGRLDAFEWRAPSQRVAQLVELEKEPKRKEVQALPPVPPPDMPAAAIEEAEVEAADEEPAEPVLEKATAAPVDGKSAEAPVEAPAEDVEPAKPVTAAKPAAKDVKASAPERREENFGPAVVAPAPVLDAEPSADEERERAAPIRLPDDPGVDGDEGAAEPRRFRLF